GTGGAAEGTGGHPGTGGAAEGTGGRGAGETGGANGVAGGPGGSGSGGRDGAGGSSGVTGTGGRAGAGGTGGFMASRCDAATPRAGTYFIDASAGRDTNDGATPATAWQTLTKVNATTFQAGDA